MEKSRERPAAQLRLRPDRSERGRRRRPPEKTLPVASRHSCTGAGHRTARSSEVVTVAANGTGAAGFERLRDDVIETLRCALVLGCPYAGDLAGVQWFRGRHPESPRGS